MKKTTLALAIVAAFSTSSVFAWYMPPPPQGSSVTVNKTIDVDVDKNIDITLNADVTTDTMDVVITSEQVNLGDVNATVDAHGTGQIGNQVNGGISGNLNSVGVSATAVANNKGVNIAGKGATLTHSYGMNLTMGSESLDVMFDNEQIQSGDISASVVAGGGYCCNGGSIGNVVNGGIGGDSNSVSVAATAVANSSTVNVGGVIAP